MPKVDGIWNNGESPFGTDRGGFHNLDLIDPVTGQPRQPVLGVHAHQYLTNQTPTAAEGWVLRTANWDEVRPPGAPPGNQQGAYWMLRGYFRDQALLPNDPIDDGAFSVTVRDGFDPQKQTVIVIVSPSTFNGYLDQPHYGRGPAEDRGRFGYAGWTGHSGLTGQKPGFDPGNPYPPDANYSPPQPGQHPVGTVMHLENAARGNPYNLVVATAIPRIVSRAMTHQVQRNVLLVRTVQAMLQSSTSWRPPNFPRFTAKVPALLNGGSYGGYTAMICVAFFGNDFHGAFTGGTPASVRRYISEQESWQHQMALCGFVGSGKAFANFDVLHYARIAWQYEEEMKAPPGPFPTYPWGNWSPFFHTSMARLWRDEKLPRPVYLVINDEDSVTTGTDSLPLFDGMRAYHDHGSATNNSGVKVLWTTVAKRCHDSGLHRTAGGVLTQYLGEDLFEFIPEALASFNNPNHGLFQPPSPANATEDPYAALTITPYNPTSSPDTSTPLRLDAGFGLQAQAAIPAGARRSGKLFGSGTFLGGSDSLVIYKPTQEIYVGSAEGVVTRFRRDPNTNELVPQATSPALGYGVWGLTVAEFIPDIGDEVVAATWRGMFVLNRTDLSIQRQNTNLPWHQARPRFLKPVYVQGQRGVVCATDHGDIALFSGDMVLLASYGEPGIADLEVLGVGGNVITLALLSERGHVIKVAWDVGVSPSTMQVLAVSERINGDPKDLEQGMWNGAPAVFALYADTPNVVDPVVPKGSTVRVLSANDLVDLAPGVVTSAGNTVGFYGSTFDLELLVSGNTVSHFLVLAGGSLHLVGSNNFTTIATKNLGSFAPMVFARDIAVGDISRSPSPPNLDLNSVDLVVSTQPGYVAWQPMAEVATAGTVFPLIHQPLPSTVSPNTVRQAGNLNAAPAWCNRTLAATWAMCTSPAGNTLELLDQSGSRWRVDGSGNTTFLYQIPIAPPGNGAGGFGLHPGPFRDMFWSGMPPTAATGVASALSQHVAVFDQSTTLFVPGGPGSILQYLTAPYVPHHSEPYPNFGFGLWTNDPAVAAHLQYLYDGYAVFPKGGHVTLQGDPDVPGSSGQAHWWAGQEHNDKLWGNLVQGLHYHHNPSTNQNQILNWWASTARTGGTAGPAQQNVPHAHITGHDLRNFTAKGLAMHDAQSLRLFKNPADNRILAALSTPGGRVIVLHPAPQPNVVDPLQVESDDFGYGGMALAVAPNQSDPSRVDIYLGILTFYANNAYHSDDTTSAVNGDMVGAVVALRWNGSGFDANPPVRVLDQGAERAYGVCGIAVGELIPGNATQEIVVGTLDGRVLVYERALGGGIGGLLSAMTLEGALGAFNSIVIADLDNNQQNELYVAGSFGLRKFVYAAQP